LGDYLEVVYLRSDDIIKDMNNISNDGHKKAMLTSLYQRISARLNFLNHKKHKLVSELIKKSDNNKLEKIRQDILKS
jgi:hypothetical protein